MVYGSNITGAYRLFKLSWVRVQGEASPNTLTLLGGPRWLPAIFLDGWFLLWTMTISESHGLFPHGLYGKDFLHDQEGNTTSR